MWIDRDAWSAATSTLKNRAGIPLTPCKGAGNSRISKARTQEMIRDKDPVNRAPKRCRHSSMTFCIDIDCTNKHASDIALAARTHRFGAAFAKSRGRTKLALSKEIVMNTEKVIELGKVSEETKGVIVGSEGPDLTHGPGA
jgi:hypothetical protein